MKLKKHILILIIFASFSTFANPIKIDTITLEDKHLKVQVSTLGAEIISIYNKTRKIEHLWQGEKTSWNQHAPILFPIVGKLKNKQYTIDGKTYKMKNHGFAATSAFTLIKQSQNKVVLQLQSNEKTLKQYPYHFKLMVTYTLKGNKLSISNIVKNIDNKDIYFSIGAHPGFTIPFTATEKYNDYYLQFCKKETASRLPLTKKSGFLSNKHLRNFIKNTNKLHLNHQLFKDRAIILEGIKSKKVIIKSNQSKIGVEIGGIHKFPFLGIWTSFKKDAPFICIEPWYGISDKETTSGDFKTKKGIQKLDVGNNFAMKYYIKIKTIQ